MGIPDADGWKPPPPPKPCEVPVTVDGHRACMTRAEFRRWLYESGYVRPF